MTEIEFINGLFTLILVIIFMSVSLTIISKYFKSKEPMFLYVGITWGIMAEAWIPNAISFVIVLIISTSEGLPIIPFLIIGTSFYPVGLLCWTKAFTDFFYKERQKIVLCVMAIISILFEIFFFTFLVIDSTIIGEKTGIVDTDYGLFVTAFQIFLIFYILFTGLKFASETMKSGGPERELKGKLLRGALIIFVIGALLDALGAFLTFLDLIYVVLLLVARILLTISAVGFYGAFLLPEWMKKRLLK